MSGLVKGKVTGPTLVLSTETEIAALNTGTATTAQIATAFNLLLVALKANGIIKGA